MINFHICENEETQRNLLFEKIKKLHIIDDHRVFMYTTEEELISQNKEIFDFNIFILDICLKDNKGDDQSGINLAKLIKFKFPKSVIVFITAYQNFFKELYEVDHCYCIYKPELDQRLKSAIGKAIDCIKKINQRINLETKTGIIILNTDDILYIESKKRDSLIYYCSELYDNIDVKPIDRPHIRTTKSFTEIKKNLPCYFIQCHKSFMINLGRISSFNRTTINLQHDIKIPIGRTYEKNTKEEIFEYSRSI